MNARTLLRCAALAPAPLFLLAPTASAQACPLQDIYEPWSNSCTSTGTNQLPLGFTSQLSVGPFVGDADYWRFTLQPNESVVVDLFFVHGAGNIDAWLRSGDCNTVLTSSRSTANLEQIVHTNLGTSAQEYVLEVDMGIPLTICNTYNMNASIEVSPCLWPNGDAFEGSGMCGQGTIAELPLGLTTLLTAGNDAGGSDYWSITLDPLETGTIDVMYSPSEGYPYSGLYLGECVGVFDNPTQTPNGHQVTFSNMSGAPQDYTLVIEHNFPAPSCQEYSLNLAKTTAPCANGLRDIYHPNATCLSAPELYAGTYPDLLTYKSTAEDFYRIDILPGVTLNVDVLFAHADGDIDVYLYDEPLLSPTCGDKSSDLARAVSMTDNASLSYTNTTNALQELRLQVGLADLPGNAECNTYELVIDILALAVSDPMCVGDGSASACPCDNESAPGSGEGCASSLGHGATLSASGLPSVSDDVLTFTVSQARANQPALLVQGASLTQVPFKDGVLCTGNPTERVEVLFTDANGNGTTTGSVVTNGDVSAGNIRWYQMWYRDPGGVSPCGTGSNFSSGLRVVFLP